MTRKLIVFGYLLSVLTMGDPCGAAAQTNFWQQTNGPYGGAVHSLAINASNHIFAGTDSGVYRSTNNGVLWMAGGLTNISVSGLATSPGGNLFAGTYHGVYRSTDEGISWTQITTGLTDTLVSGIFVNETGRIFFGTFYDNGTFGTLYRSTDDGNSWISTGLMDVGFISFAANAGGDIFVGAAYNPVVYRSTDNGGSWTNHWLGLDYSPDVSSLAIDSNGRLLAGMNYGGRVLWRSPDNGDSWTEVDLGLMGISYVSSLLVNSNGHIFAGTDNGILRSTDSGSNWSQINSGLTDTVVTCLLPNSNGYIFAGTQMGGVFRSVESTTLPFVFHQTYANGWNMNSLPLHVLGNTKSALFPSATSPA